MATATARAASLRVAQFDAASDPGWAAFVAGAGGGLFHSPAWAAVLRDTYGFAVDAHALVDGAGRIVAGLPVCRIDDAVGRRSVSLPFSDHCNPLVGDREQRRLLLDTLRDGDGPVSILTLGADDAPEDEHFPVVKRARWQGIELHGDVDTLWAQLAATTRRAIRKAQREGVRVEAGDGERFLRDFSRMHVAVRRHKYRLLAQPPAFFAAIARHFAPAGAWLPLAAFHGDRCIAATIFLAWGDTLYYRFNTSALDALALRPNDLLLWEGIRLGVARGCRRLDFGRSDDDQPGLIRFKRQFGAGEREIRLLRYSPLAEAADGDAQSRRLLAALTSVLTDPAVPDDVCAAAGTALYRYFA